ncbi:MAG: T9SS type A sorting domain-containing protein [Flavobacteriales bacterium]|nr:T9SS type A sorting domain-containing protein [Flavobacteriales bacterium]
MTKTLLVFALTACCLLSAANLFAQCPTCIPDETCTSVDGLPSACPLELPTATTNVYYENYITFYLPASFNYQGNEVEMDEVTILSINGLPFGMDYSINDPDATYYPQMGENYGCATLCGTPVLPGVYDLNISIHAIVSVSGFQLEQNQSFFFTFVVEQGEGGNASFSYDNQAGCGEATVTYEALLNLPTVTQYAWDFGNGETSTEQFPAPVTYTGAGEYVATLTTTVSDYNLNAISISSLNDNWDGDVDDIFSPPADVFFTIIDGDGTSVYSSSTVDNYNSPSWSALNILLNNPPYQISFTDVDDISADDDLGTATLTVQDGIVYFDTGNGTIGTANIALEVTAALTNQTTISIFPIPNATFDVNGNTLSYSDATLTGFIWFVNGEPILNEFASSLVMTTGGIYTAQVSNEFGCTAMSQETLWCPPLFLLFDEGAEVVYIEGDYTSYQWYYMGAEIDGGTTYFTDATALGNYSVLVTTDYGCETLSETYIVTVGLDEFQTPSPTAIGARYQIAPNPVLNQLNITCSDGSGQLHLTIYNLLGKMVLDEVLENSGGKMKADVTHLQPGLYLADVNGERIRVVKK